jgi:ankyrin repeat protein
MNDNLIYAIKDDDFDQFVILMNQNNISTEDKNHILIEACSCSNFEMVTYLIERGADIHVNEDMPLRMAVSRGPDLTKYLIENGANIQAKNLMRDAAEMGWTETVKYLAEKGLDLQPAIETACYYSYLDVIKCLVEECGADIQTVIKSASENEQCPEVIDYLNLRKN